MPGHALMPGHAPAAGHALTADFLALPLLRGKGTSGSPKTPPAPSPQAVLLQI